MAESIVSDIAIELISKLGSFTLKEIGVCWGLRDDLEKLRRTVATIEAVLLHADEQSIHNPQVKHWLGMLSEALYDADDLLDEFSYEDLRQQIMGGSKVAKKVCLFFSSSNQFAFGLKMGQKVEALRERLDEIADEKNKFHLEERSVVERSFVPSGRYQTHSSPPQVVIGREHDNEEIVRLLLSSDCKENVSVIPIVGIGGLGKTTLAQMVYNEERVKNHFELKMWVCVFDDFGMKLLVKDILESASRQATHQNTQMDLLTNRLHEYINGRRYLLVLDDVWNEDVNKWSSFKDLLDGGARGSKIIITTRVRTVAEISRPIFIHFIKGLSENEAWSLFKQMAFKQQQPPNPSFEANGKEIVAKCCGVPLAIKTIGGMLYFKDLESEWQLFKDKELSMIDVYKNDILPILKLSYNHLPSHYKHCFAHCSLYPKDFPIPVEQLIHLWKAQGYIKSTNSNECLHDIGFGYFMDLDRLSFFQDVEKDDFGNIVRCKIHDLMHDLAILVAGDNYSASHSGMVLIQEKTQHVSFWGANYFSLNVSSLLKSKKIRTVLPLDDAGIHIKNKKDIDVLFCNLRCLRVLDLSRKIESNALPNSIYKLKHLRYLDLSLNYDSKRLPNSFISLHNLQVLKLEACKNLVQLPSNISKLINLTYLNNGFCCKLSHMPRGIGRLSGLEKLAEFVICKDHSISKNIGGLDELHSLNNLRGELKIMNLRYLKNPASEYMEAHLSSKQKLQKLALNWEAFLPHPNWKRYSANDVKNEEMGIEALCPNPNLKQLEVLHYTGVKPPGWLPLLTYLVSIGLSYCESIVWLPPLDQLPHLKGLCLSGLTKLEQVDVENGSGGSSLFFPSLTDLFLFNCPNLKGFERRSTEELPFFPCLSWLEIRGCPNLTHLPLFPKLEKLESDGDGMKSLMAILATQSPISPFSVLSHLQHLNISNMEDSLQDKFLQNLPSLQFFQLSRCSFKNVCRDEEEWQSLKVLHGVAFYFMENLEALPKGLQYVTNLQRLDINHCPSLTCIPEWMPKLIALQNLTIAYCPQLEERCDSNLADDWPKIHIPNIQIGWTTIQRNGSHLGS